MVKIILVGIIVALVYSQPNLRLTIADWLNNASEFLNESVDKKQEDYKELRFKTNESIKNNWEYTSATIIPTKIIFTMAIQIFLWIKAQLFSKKNLKFIKNRLIKTSLID